MTRFALVMAVLAIVTFGTSAALPAAESGVPPLLAQRAADLPKGSYTQSCQCQISGGIFLQCFCSNLNARMFQTNLDVRTCPQPKDIRNCNGTLKCTDKGQEC